MSAEDALAGLWAGVRLVTVTVSAALTSALVGWTATVVWHDRMAAWVTGRAAGVTSYLLLVVLTVLGLLLSHPGVRWHRPSRATRLRLHVSLAVFTLAFTALHVLVLATDPYAGVGWRGTFVPMASTYRPVPVTFGVIGLYAGLLAGLTAALAGRIRLRLWWPIHKVAVVALVLVWVHGLQAGADSAPLRWMYVGTGAAVLALAASRYVARSPSDWVDELAAGAGTAHPADRTRVRAQR